MNWINSIRELLGKFWKLVFGEPEFIHGIENVCALLGRSRQAVLDARLASKLINGQKLYIPVMPHVVYLLASRQETDPSTGDIYMRDCIVHPMYPLDEVLSDGSTHTLGDRDPNGGWILEPKYNVPPLHFMSDHVAGYTVTFFDGFDYDFDGNAFLFHVDPRTISPALPTVNLPDEQGRMCIYYKLVGWEYPALVQRDMIDLCYSSELTPVADIVWDIHINGANYVNTKNLLSKVAGAVVCTEDGVVENMWTEQNDTVQCVKIGTKIYHADASLQAHFTIGDTIQAGDVLYGDFIFLSGDDVEQMPHTISVASGSVTDLYIDLDISGMQYMTVTSGSGQSAVDRIYCAPVSWTPTKSVGQTVAGADIELFSPPADYVAGTSFDYSDLPGIRVNTDAGSLVALNVDMKCDVQSGVNILPLSDAKNIAKYRLKCVQLANDDNSIKLDVPDIVNPFIYVMKNLRGGTSLFASMSVSDPDLFSASVSCVRKAMNAGGMLTIYVKAEGEQADLTLSGFTATSGNVSVAVDASPTMLLELTASAEVIV